MREGMGWIVDADVSGYFDSIDRARLREVLRKRVNDGRIWRLIGKWLRAGVMEEGVLTHPETGVVQGGVISPVLANIFLHDVLDEWFEREVRPRLKGRCFLIRCADGTPVQAWNTWGASPLTSNVHAEVEQEVEFMKGFMGSSDLEGQMHSSGPQHQ
jgi:retron-type reverse transcriptase